MIDYVDGRDDALHEVLWAGLEEAAAALDFERASRLRRDLQTSLSLTAAQRRMREATEANWALVVTPGVEPGIREVMVVLRGRLWAQLNVQESSDAGVLASRLERCWERYAAVGLRDPDHDSVDDMHILGSWLARHDGHPAILALGERDAEPDWRSLAARVLALRRDQLDFDAWLKARDAGDSRLGADGEVGDGAIVVDA